MDNDLIRKLEMKKAEVQYAVLDRLTEALDDNDLELIDLLTYVYTSLC